MLVVALVAGAVVVAASLGSCAARGDGAAAGSAAGVGSGVGQPAAVGQGEAAASGDSVTAVGQERVSRDRTKGARTFVYECEGGSAGGSSGGSADGLTFAARIEGETAWLFLPGETVSLPYVAAASGAKYTDGESLFWSKGEEALLEWRGRRHSGCRNNRRAAIWEHAKLSGVDFRAVGQEPGWHLEIRRADTVVLVSDYGSVRHTFPWAEPLSEAGAARTTYWVQSGRDELKVVLQPGPCHDTMSGEQYETKVTVWLNGRELRGCGRALH